MAKAILMNSYFSTIGERLADELPPPATVIECVIRYLSASAEPPPLSEITVSQGPVCKNVQLLMMNKSTGPDHIPWNRNLQEQQSFLLKLLFFDLV